MDSRRNLDFAFPPFAPGLPSVYERAGFEVNKTGTKSSSSSVRSHGSSHKSPSLSHRSYDSRSGRRSQGSHAESLSRPTSKTSPESHPAALAQQTTGSSRGTSVVSLPRMPSPPEHITPVIPAASKARPRSPLIPADTFKPRSSDQGPEPLVKSQLQTMPQPQMQTQPQPQMSMPTPELSKLNINDRSELSLHKQTFSQSYSDPVKEFDPAFGGGYPMVPPIHQQGAASTESFEFGSERKNPTSPTGASKYANHSFLPSERDQVQEQYHQPQAGSGIHTGLHGHDNLSRFQPKEYDYSPPRPASDETSAEMYTDRTLSLSNSSYLTSQGSGDSRIHSALSERDHEHEYPHAKPNPWDSFSGDREDENDTLRRPPPQDASAPPAQLSYPQSNGHELDFGQPDSPMALQAPGFLGVPQDNVNRFSTTSSIYTPGLADSPARVSAGANTAPAWQDRYSESTPALKLPTKTLSPPPAPAPVPVHALPPIGRGAGRVGSPMPAVPQGQAEVQVPFHDPKVCRGCHEPITGKSIYSKDGNMTGRWHRACFKCTQCTTPLSDEVYVLNDSPYCQDCYHVVNQSTCRTCGLGIEGDCLETYAEDDPDQIQYIRYHIDCLRCDTCSTALLDSYFELNGKTFCDQHGNPNKLGTAKVQKRMTRLMMI